MYNATEITPYGIELENTEVIFGMDYFLNPTEMLLWYNQKYPNKKIIIPKPGGKHTRYNVEVLQTTNNELIVYAHSSGNHWNISGNHCFYKHIINNEIEYIDSYGIDHKTILHRSKLLMSDYKKFDFSKVIY